MSHESLKFSIGEIVVRELDHYGLANLLVPDAMERLEWVKCMSEKYGYDALTTAGITHQAALAERFSQHEGGKEVTAKDGHPDDSENGDDPFTFGSFAHGCSVRRASPIAHFQGKDAKAILRAGNSTDEDIVRAKRNIKIDWRYPEQLDCYRLKSAYSGHYWAAFLLARLTRLGLKAAGERARTPEERKRLVACWQKVIKDFSGRVDSHSSDERGYVGTKRELQAGKLIECKIFDTSRE